MLSPLATTLFTWAAIYAYVGVFYCMLHLRRPTHREYLAFGLLCFGLGAWTAGSALLEHARSMEDALFASQLQHVGGFAAVAFFIDFVTHLVGLRARRMVLSGYAISALAIAVAASGLLFEPHSSPATWGPALASPRIEPQFSVLGIVVVGCVLALVTSAIVLVARRARNQKDLRALFWAGVIALLAAVHDSFARTTHMRSLYLLDHAGLFPVVAVSYVLVRRFTRAADELGRRTAELRRSYSELRVTQDELVRKEQLAAVGELSAVIAHEVRNPLAIIKNAVSSLRRPTLRANDRGVLLGILDEEVDRLNRLVRDLLAYARPVEPRGRAIQLKKVILEAIQTALPDHDTQDSIELDLDLESCPTIYCDPDLLRQALVNVIDNAVSAMPSGGKLSVRCEPDRLDGRSAASIEFHDSGAGMDSLVLAKARDPFFTTRPSGTGLGLAIVERVIKNHLGTLSIESEPGEGTLVRIVLPKERPSSVPPAPEDE